MPSVSMSLNHVAGSCACACANHCALLAAYQRTAHGPGNAADDCSPTPAVVMPSSLGKAVTDKCSKQ
jgi:hypothetical protein